VRHKLQLADHSRRISVGIPDAVKMEIARQVVDAIRDSAKAGVADSVNTTANILPTTDTRHPPNTRCIVAVTSTPVTIPQNGMGLVETTSNRKLPWFINQRTRLNWASTTNTSRSGSLNPIEFQNDRFPLNGTLPPQRSARLASVTREQVIASEDVRMGYITASINLDIDELCSDRSVTAAAKMVIAMESGIRRNHL
jgi:hypothetical protein